MNIAELDIQYHHGPAGAPLSEPYTQSIENFDDVDPILQKSLEEIAAMLPIRGDEVLPTATARDLICGRVGLSRFQSAQLTNVVRESRIVDFVPYKGGAKKEKLALRREGALAFAAIAVAAKQYLIDNYGSSHKSANISYASAVWNAKRFLRKHPLSSRIHEDRLSNRKRANANEEEARNK